MDNKDEKCIFISYKYCIKGFKVWNPITKNIVYNREVVFREGKYVPKHEVTPMENELEKIEFELEDQIFDSIEGPE